MCVLRFQQPLLATCSRRESKAGEQDDDGDEASPFLLRSWLFPSFLSLPFLFPPPHPFAARAMMRLAVALAAAVLIAAPALSKPTCPAPPTVDTVKLDDFMGTW